MIKWVLVIGIMTASGWQAHYIEDWWKPIVEDPKNYTDRQLLSICNHTAERIANSELAKTWDEDNYITAVCKKAE